MKARFLQSRSRLRHAARLILATALPLLFFAFVSIDSIAAAPSKRKVLILYSMYNELPWQAGVRTGLHTHVQQAAEADRADIYEESLDAGRIQDLSFLVSFENYLRSKYAHLAFDAVISESQSAANFLTARPDLFAAAKRYMVNVSEDINISSGQSVVIRNDPGLALLTIPRLMPDRERIVVVVDRTVLGGHTIPTLLEAAKALPEPMQLDVLENFSFAELDEKVRNLPTRSALLYFPTPQDRHGAREIPRRVVERLATIANAPIFVHHDSFLNTGVVGGYVLSARGVGHLIANLSLGLPPPNGMEEINALVKGYQFDDRQLQRWRIADERLPNPHTIINREPSVWWLYRWQISSVFILITLEFLSIVLLLRAMRERKHALDSLRLAQSNLELRVQERTLSLSESETRLRTIIKNEPECIKIVDTQGTLTQMNPAGLRMIEADSEDQVVGKPVVAVIAPEYRTAFTQMHQRVIAGEAVQMEFEVLGLKGGRRWLETHAVPMQEHGQTVHLAVTRDITGRKHAEDELLRSNTELEQFSYSISHDLRQPLRMVSSYLQLLQRSLGDTLDAEKREFFNFAIDGAKRMDTMMLGLLEYSRVGRKGEPPAWIDSRAVLDEVLLFLQPLVAEAQANVHIEGQWPRIFASPDEILRLLQNLIGNALKFRVAGRTPEITVRSETTDYEWRLCISDNGIGIQPEQITRLFQVFSRLQLRTAYEGNGIGLALCRKIVEHHSGRIRVESDGEGQGSRFYVALPLRQKEDEIAP